MDVFLWEIEQRVFFGDVSSLSVMLSLLPLFFFLSVSACLSSSSSISQSLLPPPSLSVACSLTLLCKNSLITGFVVFSVSWSQIVSQQNSTEHFHLISSFTMLNSLPEYFFSEIIAPAHLQVHMWFTAHYSSPLACTIHQPFLQVICRMFYWTWPLCVLRQHEAL